MSLHREELMCLYSRLLPEERDDLLQCLAPRGGEAMIEVLEDELLCHAGQDLRDTRAPSGSGAN